MIALLVTFSLFAAGQTDEKRIDFPQKPVAPLVTPGIPRTPGLQNRIDFFEKKIRPVLATRCYKCHSAQAASVQKLKGGLRLDVREGWERGGDSGPALVPGDPGGSLLIGAIRYTDADLQMPPDGKLSPSVIADFEAWVKMGAPDSRDGVAADGPGPAAIDLEEARKFWAFQVPVEPVIPDVDLDSSDARFVRSPLDRLVLAPLLKEGSRPAAPADRRTLIRRVTFDLTGLPPSPGEVESFVSDPRPDAYERLVDRLLASPRHGERWGRHWLDVARYADSNGLDENLAYVQAFRYRDHVIQSFNADEPYDRMLHEQIAGDLLVDEPGVDVNAVKTATGFLSLGPKMLACDDGRKMQMDIVDEQVDTVCRATMALTMGCARCHDHKFDPLSTKDYYALAGIFKSTKTMENFKVVARWHENEVATEEERESLRRHQEREKANERAREETHRRAVDAFLAAERARAAGYVVAAAEFVRAGGPGHADGETPLGDDVLAEGLGDRIGVLREAEEYTRGTLVKDTTNWGKGIGVLLQTGHAEHDIELPGAGLYQLELRYAAQESRPVKLSLNGKVLRDDAAGETTGGWYRDRQRWFIEGVYEFRKGKNVLRLERAAVVPHIDKILILRVADGTDPRRGLSRASLARRFELRQELLGDFVDVLLKAKDDESSPWRELLRGEDFAEERWLEMISGRFERAALSDTASEDSLAPYRSLLTGEGSPFEALNKPERFFSDDTKKAIAALEKERKELEGSRPKLPRAMGVREGEIEDLRVHLRGSYLTLGETVRRGPPRVLAGEGPSDFSVGGDRSGRLELAHWLTHPGHPLTARVMVNRVWLWHFGEGIVRSADNFGRLGERPTNQPLLDWLALRFVESGWSIKALHRRILLSGTYRMSAAVVAEAEAKDPENRLLAHFRRRRLQAEEIRDSLLNLGGDLDLSMYGQLLPDKDREYVTGTGSKEGTYDFHRRSVYLPILRSAVYNVLQAFDFADPSVLNGRRATTTVTPQALFLMNGKLVQEETLRLAESLLVDRGLDDRGRVRALYSRALSRPASDVEVDRALDFLREYRELVITGARDGGKVTDETEIAKRAWQGLCRVIVASNEFVYIE